MLKYFIYTRKSTDREDRQVQSIADQRGVLLEIAERRNLHIENIFEESASAKDPGRPIFNQMLKRIEKGEANGILCWKLNRLTRNLADAGRIGQALQDEIIQHIVTVDREFYPTDNVLVMQFEFGEATQYIRNLRTDVKRGMLRRLKEGHYPFPAPLGYINDRNTRTIVPDPERFDLIKKMWDLMLTGKYTPAKIRQIANNEWSFRTPTNRKFGDVPLSYSGIYSMFSNLFYTGIMRSNGAEYPGKHKPMITLSDFKRVQNLLSKKGKPRCAPKYKFSYVGIFTCGECGCAITAQQKRKLNKNIRGVKLYTYYHCTHRSESGKNCRQRESLREEEIEKQIIDFLDGFKLSEGVANLALEYLREWNAQETKTRESLHFNHENQIALKHRKLSSLIDMRCRDLISDDDFIEQRNTIQREILLLKEQRMLIDEREKNWIQTADQILNFANSCRQVFAKGDKMACRMIVSSIGQNHTIQDGKLVLKPHPWLLPVKNLELEPKRENKRLEPGSASNTNENSRFSHEFLSWWAKGNEVRTFAVELKRAIISADQPIIIPNLGEFLE